MITYAELKALLSGLDEEEMLQPVTILDECGQQFIKISSCAFSNKDQADNDGFFKGVPEGTFYLTLEVD